MMNIVLSFLANHPVASVFLGIMGALVLVALRDVFFQRHHAIQHNFPIVGHLRYWLETIGPELRQYWVANDKEEMPFNRDERRWVYATAKQENNTFGFGTTEMIYGSGYPILKHAAFPYPGDQERSTWPDPTAIPCQKIMGASHNRKKQWRPTSVINISAMSFGSLGAKAVSSLNQGAGLAHCFQNTGEGGISPYHLSGADIVWQLGTGYFGARDKKGQFSIDVVKEQVAKYPQIRAIEVKLSQGAKPGKGGILPGVKVTPEIAAARGIPVGKDCISPSRHSQFSTVDEMITFIEVLATETGLPIGIKSAIGEIAFWQQLSKRMKERGEGPDYIVVDGGEGGTGAAPLAFADHVSLPFKIGFSRVYQTFQKAGVENDVVWIGAGKLGFPDRAMVAMAMGCDMIYVAREAMFSIGCIQALKCHTDRCPAGVATQSKWLQGGLDPALKSVRAANYIKGFRKELLALANAAGYAHPAEIKGADVEFSTGVNQFKTLEEVLGYQKTAVISPSV